MSLSLHALVSAGFKLEQRDRAALSRARTACKVTSQLLTLRPLALRYGRCVALLALLHAGAQMADTVCAPQMRNNVEFQKLLAVAIAGLLAGCNDPDSDVRIAADESLNRTITTLIDTHLGRLQVELCVTHVHIRVRVHVVASLALILVITVSSLVELCVTRVCVTSR